MKSDELRLEDSCNLTFSENVLILLGVLPMRAIPLAKLDDITMEMLEIEAKHVGFVCE